MSKLTTIIKLGIAGLVNIVDFRSPRNFKNAGNSSVRGILNKEENFSRIKAVAIPLIFTVTIVYLSLQKIRRNIHFKKDKENAAMV